MDFWFCGTCGLPVGVRVYVRVPTWCAGERVGVISRLSWLIHLLTMLSTEDVWAPVVQR